MIWDHLTMLCCLKDNAQINITFVLIMPSFLETKSNEQGRKRL